MISIGSAEMRFCCIAALAWNSLRHYHWARTAAVPQCCMVCCGRARSRYKLPAVVSMPAVVSIHAACSD